MICVMYKEEDMKQSYYLYRSGRLQRKDNTLEIVYKDINTSRKSRRYICNDRIRF